MTTVIFAGEIIFSLPFHIPRFFRPTMLEALQLSNTQLGDIFAVYGITAMLAYFPGGMIADHFSARKLMSVSLLTTSMGGFYLYTLPTLTSLYWLFAYWGFTTILLFWAAMIKATREWAAADTQGLAFGLLDGGRGLVASIFASIGVLIINLQLADQSTNETAIQALQSIILFYSLSTVAAAVIIWLMLPESFHQSTPTPSANQNHFSFYHNVITVLSNKTVWLQAGVVITAYCGFKALDNYGLFAVQVLGMSAVESAEFISYASYARPIAAIAAGLLVDRWQPSKMILTLFFISAITFSLLSMISPEKISVQLIIANLLITFIAVYALRGVYFTLLEESNLKSNVTGKAVGLISVLGYTPDIFFSPLTGRILDANPGLTGFQHYFMFIAAISVAGLIVAYWLMKQLSNNQFST